MKKILMTALMLVSTGAWAQMFTDGVHYTTLDTPIPTTPDAVEVTEAFSYLCNHCKTFEPYMQAWLKRKPEGTVLTRVPVEFGRAAWSLYARGYVTADVMGIAEESHVPMMDAIWIKRRQMRNLEQLADFYAEHGADRDEFLATASSFAVDMRIRKEQQMMRDAGVSGTPTLIVAGKYRVNAGGANASFDAMLAVVDHLVAKELAERSTAAVSAESTPEVAAE